MPPNDGDAHAIESRGSSAKIRETDKISLLLLSAPPQFDAWKIALRSELVATSGRHNSAFRWIIK
eukprot:93464-Heterocapsa_arctica.AAC.1